MQKIVDKLTGSDRYVIALLAVLSSVFFIGLGKLHLFDWDEINFAESAREMIKSGDYLHVQINFVPFWEKPPFFFWLQAASMQILGISEYAARFPNAVFGFIYLITLYFIGKKHFSSRFGLIWSLLLFGTLLPHIYFKSGIIDPVFNYFIFMSIYFLIRVIGGSKNAGRLALLSGIFSGLSVLTKGPVGFLLLGLTLLIYLIIKKFKPFPKVKYIVLFFTGLIAVISSWLLAELAQNDWDNLMKFIVYQAELFNQNVAGHEQPFFYHFVVVLLGCFPISFIAIPGFKRREDTPLDFQTWMIILFWVVMIVFSITTTKIIHYSSMTYVPLAFLASYALTKKEGFRNWVPKAYLIHGLFIAAGLIIIPVLLIQRTWLLSMISNKFTLDCLSADLHWNYVVFGSGSLVAVGTIISFILFRKDIIKALLLHSLFLGSALLIALYTLLPNIEMITQNPAIEFYKDKSDEQCYIETIGFKSYAQYYYGKTRFDEEPETRSSDWIISNVKNKKVYLVSKSDNLWIDEHYTEFQFLYQKGGYRFYVREPNN